jgi:hypothetical protein
MGRFKLLFEQQALEELCELLEYCVENNISLDDRFLDEEGGMPNGMPRPNASAIKKLQNAKIAVGKSMRSVPIGKKLNIGGQQDAKHAMQAADNNPQKAMQFLQKRYQTAVQALRGMMKNQSPNDENQQQGNPMGQQGAQNQQQGAPMDNNQMNQQGATNQPQSTPVGAPMNQPQMK